MTHNVLLMRVNQIMLAITQVGKHLVIKVNLLHVEVTVVLLSFVHAVISNINYIN